MSLTTVTWAFSMRSKTPESPTSAASHWPPQLYYLTQPEKFGLDSNSLMRLSFPDFLTPLTPSRGIRHSEKL